MYYSRYLCSELRSFELNKVDLSLWVFFMDDASLMLYANVKGCFGSSKAVSKICLRQKVHFGGIFVDKKLFAAKGRTFLKIITYSKEYSL